MVQTTSVALFCLLVAPSIAVPITNDQHARAEDLSERDPNWFSSAVGAVRKVATPPNIAKAGRFAAGLLLREDAEEIFQRDLEFPESIETLVTRDDEFQLTERDVEFLRDLTARDPSWFKSAFRAVRKVATPSNLMRAGKFAAGILLREDEISQRDLENPENITSLVVRDDASQLTAREIEYLKDLAARDPNWFKSAFRAVRKVATPPNLMKAGKFAAGILLREDEVEISQRDLEFPESVLVREDTEEISQRDIEYEDISTREPKSFFEKVKAFFSPKKAAKKTNSEEVEGREDDEDVFERYFDDYEMDNLD
jgi:hypothetical protein